MDQNNVLLLMGREISSLLEEKELELISVVRTAYEIHALGDTALPFSSFLRFPGDMTNRIIALPAYLGGEIQRPGLKWISSFPNNIKSGLDRASAVVLLNSVSTGRLEVVLEGSVISAKRTAASAALAAQLLEASVETIGLIGCGLINFEIAKFLIKAFPTSAKFLLFDIDEMRSDRFKAKLIRRFPDRKVEVVPEVGLALNHCSLISIATTALHPYLQDLSQCLPGSVILHVSLRDLTPEAILSCDNVVDDLTHVCRERTSIHLAQELVDKVEFVRCTIGDIIINKAPGKENPKSVTVFSPFGLGILDLALANYTRDLALTLSRGTLIKEFFPEPWACSQ